MTLNDIQHHAQELLARTHITMLIHGNIGSEVQGWIPIARAILNLDPGITADRQSYREYLGLSADNRGRKVAAKIFNSTKG
jgi:hypothetical protein